MQQNKIMHHFVCIQTVAAHFWLQQNQSLIANKRPVLNLENHWACKQQSLIRKMSSVNTWDYTNANVCALKSQLTNFC